MDELKKCQHCGAEMPRSRADRKFCSGKCKTAALRKKKASEKASENAAKKT